MEGCATGRGTARGCCQNDGRSEMEPGGPRGAVGPSRCVGTRRDSCDWTKYNTGRCLTTSGLRTGSISLGWLEPVGRSGSRPCRGAHAHHGWPAKDEYAPRETALRYKSGRGSVPAAVFVASGHHRVRWRYDMYYRCAMLAQLPSPCNPVAANFRNSRRHRRGHRDEPVPRVPGVLPRADRSGRPLRRPAYPSATTNKPGPFSQWVGFPIHGPRT
jgi:hypothetical protein